MAMTLSKFLGTCALALAGGAMLLSTATAEAKGLKRGGERPTFEQLDLNSDGQVTLEELRQRGAARFAAADTDGNGELSRAELLARANEAREGRVDRMIERLDSDNNGALSQAELEEARGKRQGKRAERMFERVDANGDGAISAEEFAAAKAKRGETRDTAN